jgi:hypothetical protein
MTADPTTLRQSTTVALGSVREVLPWNQWLPSLVAFPDAAYPGVKASQEILKSSTANLDQGMGLEWLNVSDLLKQSGDDIAKSSIQAASKLSALHLQTVCEIARVARSLASGLSGLSAQPQYSAEAAQKKFRTMVTQTFVELYRGDIEAQSQGQLVEGEEEWEDFEGLISKLESFPVGKMSVPELSNLLTDHTGLDLPARIAVSENFQTAFELLPPAGRVLYVAVTRFLAEPAVAATAAAYHRTHQDEAPKARNQMRLASNSGTGNYETEMMVQIQRVTRLLHMELALYRSLLQLHNQYFPHLGWYGKLPDFEPPVFSELVEAIGVHLELGEGERWQFGTNMPPGNTPPAPVPGRALPTVPEVPRSISSVTASDGMRFLEAQMRNKDSNYRMPLSSDAQQKWVNWFVTVELFVKMFPTPHHVVVENLTTGVPEDDVRIYGWRVLCEKFLSEQKQWGVSEFLSHVRKQVLSTVTTRKAAWDELQMLSENYTELSDCVALSTKLRNLYQQIFDTSSTEVEPASKLQCVRYIHQMLTFLHTRARTSTGIGKAWRGFTQYDSTVIFLKYIDQDKHTPLATSRLSESYLEEVCTQLTTAHDIYTQLGRSFAPPNSDQNRGRINSLSGNPNQNRPTSSNRSRSNADSRARSRSSSRSSRPSGDRPSATDNRPAQRARFNTPPGFGPSNQQPRVNQMQAQGSSQNPRQDASFLEVVQRLSRDHPELAPPYLRRRAGITPVGTQAQNYALISEGKCVLCQNSHKYKQCPLLAEGHECREAAINWLRKYKEARISLRPPSNN